MLTINKETVENTNTESGIPNIPDKEPNTDEPSNTQGEPDTVESSNTQGETDTNQIINDTPAKFLKKGEGTSSENNVEKMSRDLNMKKRRENNKPMEENNTVELIKYIKKEKEND